MAHARLHTNSHSAAHCIVLFFGSSFPHESVPPPSVCCGEGESSLEPKVTGVGKEMGDVRYASKESDEGYIRRAASLSVLRFVSYSNNSFSWTLQNTHLYTLFCSLLGFTQPVHSLFSKFSKNSSISQNEVLRSRCSRVRRGRQPWPGQRPSR